MKQISFILIFFTFLTTDSFGENSFDRAAIHEAQLSGLKLERRDISNQKSVEFLPSASSAADIALSESVAPATFAQTNASIKQLKDSSWLAVWQDHRAGSWKIFAQKLSSSGVKTGINFFTAGSSIGSDYVDPKLLVDTSGNIILCYRDQTNGLIFCTRYSSSFVLTGSPFIVNDTSSNAFAGLYDVSLFPDGRVVVVWEDYSTGGNTVAMKLLAANGSTLVGPLTVNSITPSTQRWAPSVSTQPSGGLLVAWEDYRNGQADIFCRLFSGAGAAIGADFSVVPPPFDADPQFAPEVVFSPLDKYIIGWLDRRQGQEVFAQRYDPVGGLIGGNTLISVNDTLATNWDLEFGISSTGTLLATWASFAAQNSIAVRVISNGLVPSTLRTANLATDGQRWAPSLSLGQLNRYGIVWTEVGSNENIHFMLFDNAGTRLFTPERVINDDAIGAQSTDPYILTTTNWWNLALFVDERNDAGDIYLQTFSHTGSLLQSNVKVNQSTSGSLQSNPNATSGNNKSLVVWIDSRPVAGNGGQRIFGRFGSIWGSFSEAEFMISESAQSSGKLDLKAVMNNTGRALVAWIDNRNGTPQVYGRWLSTSGQLDGAEFQISNSSTDVQNTALHIGKDNLNRFYIVWLDNGAATPTVKGRWYNPDKTPGGTFSYISSIANVPIGSLAADISTTGETVLLWTGTDTGIKKLYMTVVSSASTVAIPAFEITNDLASLADDPALAIDNDDYVSTAWVDWREGKAKVYTQLLDPAFNLIGANQPVASGNPEIMNSPSVYAERGRAWYVWSDPRSNGFNIYGNTILYLPTGADDDRDNLPVSFELMQNFPNPFNPATTIAFTIPASGEVHLNVYNLIGQNVRELVGSALAAGSHYIEWDGTDNNGQRVASGIYLYTLTVGDISQSKKMLLLK
ncbi:MAG: FlgD immunoglobulin-like domain containing protein [candidate division Zixibacteria bacterium]|nr:FlgD immunoglobulin-like domain containing protein [candidate division Zixibacteria bacterium]